MRWSFFLATVVLASPRFAGAQQTPQNQLWDRIKKQLQAPKGSEYFRYSMQGAIIPGGVGGLAGLRGTVISCEPPDRPRILTVSMTDDGIADVTLRLIDDLQQVAQPEPPQERVPPKPVARALARYDITVEDMIREWRVGGLHTGWLAGPRKPIPVQPGPAAPAADLAPGAIVEFEGIASEFSPAPFMATFDVSRSKIRIVQPK